MEQNVRPMVGDCEKSILTMLEAMKNKSDSPMLPINIAQSLSTPSTTEKNQSLH